MEKLNAGQASLFLTDIIKVCVEQTSCCWVVLSLSEALMEQCLRDCIESVKVKCSRYRPGMAQRVGRDIALLFHDRGTRKG